MRKIDCEKAQEWIVAKLDESLDEKLRGSLEQHVAACETCREAEIALKDLWSSLTEDTLEDPGEAFWKDYRMSLNGKLVKASPRPRRVQSVWRIGWKAPAVLAPAMLAVVLVFVVLSREAPRQPPVENVTCRTLLTGLNEVYGPTSEEIIPKMYSARIRSELLSARKARRAAYLLRWFEVEEELNLPSL